MVNSNMPPAIIPRRQPRHSQSATPTFFLNRKLSIPFFCGICGIPAPHKEREWRLFVFIMAGHCPRGNYQVAFNGQMRETIGN
jgi:hypothetical protein